MQKGKIRLRSRAELVDAVYLVVEHDLLSDRQRINEVADRLAPIGGAVVGGAKSCRIASRRHATTLHSLAATARCTSSGTLSVYRDNKIALNMADLQDIIMGRAGIEPATLGLKVQPRRLQQTATD